MLVAVFKKEEVFCIQNAVTFETIVCIQKKIIQLMQENTSLALYTIDFKEVTEVNSAALGLLVELKKYTITHKKGIKFIHLPERLLSLAQVCGVAEWLGLSCT